MMTLATRWAEEAMCDLPLPEYPRPQMVRENWINLNGMFDYAITDEKAEWCDEYKEQIRVPFAVESCLFIKQICAFHKKSCGSLSLDDIVEYSRMYSSEMEYSEENVEKYLNLCYLMLKN